MYVYIIILFLLIIIVHLNVYYYERTLIETSVNGDNIDVKIKKKESMTTNMMLQLLFTIITVTLIIICVKTKKQNKEQLITPYLIVLVIILFFYVCYIGKYPLGLNGDEAAVMYDGINIARYGCDRYLNKWPIYFTNSGDGQSPFFTYCFAALFKLLNCYKTIDMSTLSIDKSLILLRLPTLIYNLMAYAICFCILKKEYDARIAITSLLATLPLPICFMHSRWSLDCYYLIPNLIIASALFIKAINNKSNLFYLLSGIFFGMCLYSYAISYVVVPITLLILLIFVVIGRKFQLNNFLFFVIPIIVLAIPLFLFVVVNYFDLEEFSFLGFTITKLPRFRSGEISLENIVTNLKDFTIFKTLLFDGLDYNSNNIFVTIYYFNIPVFILGLFVSIKNVIKSIRKREFTIDFVALSLLFSNGLMSLITNPINVNKVNGIYVPLMFYIAIGYIYIYNKNKHCYRIIISIALISYLLFVNQYFSSSVYSSFISNDFLKQVQKIKELDRKNEKLVFYKITKNVPVMKTYISIYSDDYLYDPKRYENFIETDQEFPIDDREDRLYLLDDGNKEVKDLVDLGYKAHKEGKLVLLYK